MSVFSSTLVDRQLVLAFFAVQRGAGCDREHQYLAIVGFFTLLTAGPLQLSLRVASG